MELKEFVCPNCKAPLVPIKDARFMFCDYCGTRIVIDDIDFYRENSRTERSEFARMQKLSSRDLKRKAQKCHENSAGSDNCLCGHLHYLPCRC